MMSGTHDGSFDGIRGRRRLDDQTPTSLNITMRRCEEETTTIDYSNNKTGPYYCATIL